VTASTPKRHRHVRYLLWVALATVVFGASAGIEAQQGRRPSRIGVLNAAWAASHPTVEGLKAGLKDLGLEDGRDVTFDIRFTEGKLAAMPAAADALVKSGVDLIFTSQEAATQAAKDATTTVPIVFTLVGDPVAANIVQALARPGRNVTGVSTLQSELVAKRLEVLKTLAPEARRVWLIYYGNDLGTAPNDAHLLLIDSSPNIEVRLFNPIASRSARLLGTLVDFAKFDAAGPNLR